MNNELCYLSGHEALDLFRERKLSPVELMQAVIDQAEAVNPQINAITDNYFEKALEKAHKSEHRYMNGKPRKLEGLAVAVKDEFRLKGTRRTEASLVYRDRIDDETDESINRLLRAGAICHIKTTTPEFCLLGSCHSRLWGITRNPANLEITPGGSSGGSGAALAAGMTTLATGTDIGGSIRIPASQCGLVGYKPPYGRNPEIPVFNLDSYSHSGPMTRSVVDAAMMQNVISGPYNRDIASLRTTVTIDTHTIPQDLNGWKIAWSMDLGYMEIDNDVATNTRYALDVFRGLGAEVVEVEIGWTDELVRAVHRYWANMWASGYFGLIETHKDDLTDYAAWFIEISQSSNAAELHESLQVAVRMYDTFGPMMDKFDLFICPTLGTTRVPADYTWPSSAVTINGITENRIEESWSLAYPFNMLSRCPVMSVPSGTAGNNVSTGIQLVARTYDDKKVFNAARAYENAARILFSWKLDPAITRA